MWSHGIDHTLTNCIYVPICVVVSWIQNLTVIIWLVIHVCSSVKVEIKTYIYYTIFECLLNRNFTFHFSHSYHIYLYIYTVMYPYIFIHCALRSLLLIIVLYSEILATSDIDYIPKQLMYCELDKKLSALVCIIYTYIYIHVFVCAWMSVYICVGFCVRIFIFCSSQTPIKPVHRLI